MSAETASEKQFRPNLGLWAARAAVAFVFIASGWEKLPPHPSQEWIKIFAQIGWGNWFLYLTGGWEIVGGLLVLVPPLSEIGGALLVAAMAGAIGFHIFTLGDAGSSIINLGLIAAIVFASRKRKPNEDQVTSLGLDEASESSAQPD